MTALNIPEIEKNLFAQSERMARSFLEKLQVVGINYSMLSEAQNDDVALRAKLITTASECLAPVFSMTKQGISPQSIALSMEFILPNDAWLSPGNPLHNIIRALAKDATPNFSYDSQEEKQVTEDIAEGRRSFESVLTEGFARNIQEYLPFVVSALQNHANTLKGAFLASPDSLSVPKEKAPSV